MASTISGTCVPTLTRDGRMIKYQWLITADSATGDAEQSNLGNSAGGEVFFHDSIFGRIVGCRISNLIANPASAAYGVSLLRGAYNLLSGQGATLSEVDGASNQIMIGMPQPAALSTLESPHVYLWNDSLEARGSAMGGPNQAAIELYVEMPELRQV